MSKSICKLRARLSQASSQLKLRPGSFTTDIGRGRSSQQIKHGAVNKTPLNKIQKFSPGKETIKKVTKSFKTIYLENSDSSSFRAHFVRVL